ncbi:MEDS domain-containing protein [Natrarchaeobius chitinivorans]|uniref:GAF domain-containing protein n=1 Tax=Natrarchaeobius chitinivorans TaxID=1679083 RepID=A0A3N6MW02_NATCH|nr:MEDS domain-containing protein [Natrarchaeobius chitinivorans]RQG89632.1 hypothetical protein EA473_21735 [Natrarchaeobius chitinivorans]
MDNKNADKELPARAKNGETPLKVGQPSKDQNARSHYVLVYENRQEKLATVTEFLREGVQNEEKCIAIYNDQFGKDLQSALRATGVDVEAAIGKEQLEIKTVEETYLAPDEITAESMGNWIEEILDKKKDDKLIRVSGGMSWATDMLSDLGVLAEYEKLSDEIIEDTSLMALCPYNVNKFPDEFLYKVLSHHPMYRSPTGACANTFQHNQLAPTVNENGLFEAVNTLEKLSQYSSQKEKIEKITNLANRFDDREGDSKSELIDEIVNTVRILFSPSFSTVWLYDHETGSFRPNESTTESGILDTEAITDALSDRTWEIFTREEGIQREPISFTEASDGPADLPLGETVSVPLGRHGVLVAVFPDYMTLNDYDIAVLQTLQTKCRTALDNIIYQESVEEHQTKLEEQTEQIRELEEVISLLQDTGRELIDANTRTEIEQTVCNQLSSSSLVNFAWFGTDSSKDSSITPSRSCDSENDYLESVQAHQENPVIEPATTAFKNNKPVVIDDLITEPPFEPWRAKALERGYKSVASVPVCFKDSKYGVLTLFSDRTNVFNHQIEQVLENLGRCTGHAINACETKKALISEQVTELEICIKDNSLPSISLASEFDTRITFKGIVPQKDSPPRTYFTIHDCNKEEVEAFAKRNYGIRNINHIVEKGDGHLFASIVDDPCFFQILLDHGGVPCELTAEGDKAEMTLELPNNMSSGSFISMLERLYNHVEVKSSQTREREFHVREEFRQEFENEITDRQKQVLKTAYHSGFFNSPRDCTGQDLADQLGVTQPTVTENVRSAERTLLRLLFGS